MIFLNTSTIINSPNLRAESKIYSSFGQTVPSGEIGVRARLFSSGALCEATTYRYNTGPVAQFTYGTTNTCGAGWYNSHGFTAVWDGTSTYKEALTFPTDPLWWEPAAARSSTTEPEVTPASIPSGTNADGLTYGSGASATTGRHWVSFASPIWSRLLLRIQRKPAPVRTLDELFRFSTRTGKRRWDRSH